MVDVSDTGNSIGLRGILLKKAGGKALDKKTRLVERWHKRWFVLPPGGTQLSYYKSEALQLEGKPALGCIEVAGSTIFLKEVVRGQFRFTVQSMSRDLKLRALSVADFEGWMAALQPLASETKQDDEADGLADISSRLDDDCVLDDDYDSDDAMFGRDRGASRAASASIAGSSAAAGLNPPPIPPPKEERERGMTGPPPPGYRGILEKKSGGKAKAKWRMSEKWSKRWFVMAPSDSSLRYYKTEADVANGKDALGTLDCRGATIFLKEVAKSGVHRFTVRTSERELKLRATNAGDYQAWINALRPFASSFEEDDEMSVRAEPSFGGDGDDDDSD